MVWDPYTARQVTLTSVKESETTEGIDCSGEAGRNQDGRLLFLSTYDNADPVESIAETATQPPTNASNSTRLHERSDYSKIAFDFEIRGVAPKRPQDEYILPS